MLRRGWTRDELLKTLELYCLTSFGRIHSRNPEIQDLAAQLGRTASAVALKMVNFASLDPTLAQRGMANASRLDREVWDEFFAGVSASLATEALPKPGIGFAEAQRDFVTAISTFPEGLDVARTVKARVNQAFFRRLVLTSYDNKCALTGINAPELLIASHIVPWSKNVDVRTTPHNGICLNALHDRAFDEGYLTFTGDFEAIYARDLPAKARNALESFASNKLRLPSRFIPDRALLAFHRTQIFRGA
jgi:predicted restriction endonuclease